jgi:hypothetical protein
MRCWWDAFRAVAHTVVGLIRELSDENPYRRHLRAHGVQHSGEEWRRFSDARLRAKYVRPKCC